MAHPLKPRLAGSRIAAMAIAVALTLGIALTAGIALAQVSPDTDAKATGGGTVTVPVNVVASFGVNGKRPPGFSGGGVAQGRINYDRHAITPGGRHVNVPVVAMEAEITGNGGKATLSGDCNAAGAQCSNGALSVLVYVEDNAEPGTTDVFRIFFCEIGPFLPGPFDGVTPPAGCFLGEGGTLRSGNIQVRP